MIPVLLLHGLFLTVPPPGEVGQYAAQWEQLMREHGHDNPVGVTFLTNDPIIHAWTTMYKVSSLQALEVNIVAHSLGVIAARYYLKYLNGRFRVRKLVSICGTHDGLFASLYSLNAGDDTPGDVEYYDIYGPDELPFQPLGDGGSTEHFIDVPHISAPFDDRVLAKVMEFLLE